jgi:uncharacterized protein
VSESPAPVLAYFGLSYLVSWTFWWAAAATAGGAAPSSRASLGSFLLLVGTISPAAVALVLTARWEGRGALRVLLRRVVAFPSSARWYVFAISFMAASELAVALLHRAIAGEWPPFGRTPAYVMAAAILVSTPVQAGEEIGLRGYALPRLAARVGLPLASLVLGVLWASWHLPLFFIPGSGYAGTSFPLFVVAVTAISAAMAWLYWRTAGSLLVTMLMHAAINNTTGIVRSPVSPGLDPFTMRPPLTAALTAGVLGAFAAYALVRMRGAALDARAAADIERA